VALRCNISLIVITISLNLPDMLARKLDREVKRSGRSKSDIVRAALENTFQTKGKKRATFFELTSHLVECGRSPGDLSTNKKHLDDYGK
jgi:Arc/MetJ-type ribon-helix-helix transcriptional regulator